jgi:uncharacterized protein
MKIDLKKLTGKTGERIPFAGSVDLSKERMNGEYPFQHIVSYRGILENHLGVLMLRGDIETIYSTACARCLKPLEIPLKAHTDTLLTHDPAEEDSEDEVYLLEGDTVEVEDILVPALILEVDMTYLCKADCKGLCPRCGADLNVTTCTCGARSTDPRLAVLQTLLDNQQE